MEAADTGATRAGRATLDSSRWWSDPAKDVIAGTVAGVAGIATGHPLDTVKVRLQTATTCGGQAYAGVVDCVKAIVRQDGLRGLFRGMAAPIAANAPINAIVFAVEGAAMRLLRAADAGSSAGASGNGTATGQRLSAPAAHAIAGAISGLAAVPISCAADVVKIQRQVDHGKAQADYGTSWQAAADIVRRHGVRGLLRGLGLTTTRDVSAYAIYFGVYDAMKAHFTARLAGRERGSLVGARTTASSASAGGLASPSSYRPGPGPSPTTLPTVYLMVAGGTAGVASWLFLHPVDVLKSLTQGLPLNTPREAGRLLPLLRLTAAAEGGSYRFLLRGLVPTVVRAFPCSAITLPVFEFISSALHTSNAWDHDAGLHP
jgi:solute carrier family 25 carnitine/acylcarnitine transporter 20/29